MIFLCTSLTLTEVWTIIAGIGAVVTAIAAVWYTAITNKLFRSTRESIDLTKGSLQLTKDSVDISRQSIELTRQDLELTRQSVKISEGSLLLTKESQALTERGLELNRKVLEQSNKIAEYNIYMKISDSLNVEKAVTIIDACTKNGLAIESNVHSSVYNTRDRDFRCLVLGPLEDLAKFYEDGLITLDSIDSGFGYTILHVGNCEGAYKHLKVLRSTFPGSYQGFEKLYTDVYSTLSETEKDKFRPNFK